MIMEISFNSDSPGDTQRLLSIAHRIAILSEVEPSHNSVATAGEVTYVSDDTQAVLRAYGLFADVLQAAGMAHWVSGNGGNSLG